jgi:uncharacterized protein YndB with AHSA1/START domain
VADIELQLPIASDVATIFAAMTTPAGLNTWWTLGCDGTPSLGAWYTLDFGPAHHWAGVVSRCEAPHAFEWTIGKSDNDWRGTRVGFVLHPMSHGGAHGATQGVRVEFYHRGWAASNAHFRGSAYCWATYLRLLKRWVERGEQVAYAERDSA